jgi:phage-related holin
VIRLSQEIQETLSDMWSYLYKSVIYVKPLWAIITSIIFYVLFPDDSYIAPTIAVVGALTLDIITKYYSIIVTNGGIKNSIKTRKLSSETLWRGTKKKIVSVLIVLILTGLSYRLTPISAIAVVVSTLSFSIMFLREAQSCIENLIDAGHEDLKWFLFFLKKKEKDVLNSEGINENEENK